MYKIRLSMITGMVIICLVGCHTTDKEYKYQNSSPKVKSLVLPGDLKNNPYLSTYYVLPKVSNTKMNIPVSLVPPGFDLAKYAKKK